MQSIMLRRDRAGAGAGAGADAGAGAGLSPRESLTAVLRGH